MNRGQRTAYRLLVGMAVVALVAFAGWLIQPAHLPHNFTGVAHVLDLVLFGGVLLAIGHGVFMDVYLWIVLRGVRPRRVEPPVPEGLRVAFITTFVPGAEGIEVLRATLQAMVDADYPHDTWLLDEGASLPARALARELGVHYFTRNGTREYNLAAGPYKARTKGGNHNAWYDRFAEQYDVVAQIDTDFPPRQDFLTRTLGHFSDPGIAFVGTPQIYGNTSSFIARGAAEQQFGFYGPVLRGLAGRQRVNMLGANHVVRVAALRDIDFYAGHLTEDLLTGMRLHAAGWRSEYVAEPLAIGQGPDTWKAYFNQQRRWAYGCMDILKSHTVPLMRKMPRSTGLLYLALQQGYFSGIAGLVGIVLLTVYFGLGLQICDVPVVPFLIWLAPLFLLRAAIRRWMQRLHVRPDVERGFMLAGRIVGMAVWPVYAMAALRVARQVPLEFQVTPKGAVRLGKDRMIRLFLPHAVIFVVTAGCLIAGVLLDRLNPVLVFWAAITAVQTGAFTALAIAHDLRARRGERRSAPPQELTTLVPQPVSARAVTSSLPVFDLTTPYSSERGSLLEPLRPSRAPSAP